MTEVLTDMREKVIEHAARAIEKFVETSRFDHVMNEFNGEVK